MRLLYHYPLSPFSRKVRVFLKEKDLAFDLEIENYWERRREFLIMNPAAQVPVLVEDDVTLSDSTAICEYLEETVTTRPLMGKTPAERAEVRRIAGWFNNKFYYEVTKYLLDEKVFKYLRKQGEPETEFIHAGKHNMTYHLDYIAHLVKKRRWLAGDAFSFADITAAAHISVIDYLGDISWSHSQAVKDWYALVKSRPSFRPLLQDRVTGFKPPEYYEDPDF
ncbi:MAG: glutathione S-transferase family protein [Proteobacteria bacterium]|nr:glutathione S-transferase family protein [Pseudomonadota bacterium]